MIESKSVVVRYVRNQYTGEPYGCVVAVNTPDGVKTGWSQCNKLDMFNKRTGSSVYIEAPN